MEVTKSMSFAKQITKGIVYGLLAGTAFYLAGGVAAPYVAGVTAPIIAAVGFIGAFAIGVFPKDED